MENPAAFNLNEAIHLWRDRLSRLPSFRIENLDELEVHLRDSVRKLQAGGLSEEEAWLIAQKRLGYSDGLDREFAKINTPVRTARAITSMMVSILIGSILLQASFLFDLNWSWGGLNKWPVSILITTALVLPIFLLIVLPLFALLRKLNRELSWVMACGIGFVIGGGIVTLFLLSFPQEDLQKMFCGVLIGAIACTGGVMVYARFKLTSLTESMVKGAWIAMIGAWLCGLGCHSYLIVWPSWPHNPIEKWFSLIFKPLSFALVSSWFVFPVGALLGMWLSRRVRHSKPWASFGFGSVIGAAVGTLAVLVYQGTIAIRASGVGIIGAPLNGWQMNAQFAADRLSILIIPISAIWVGVWAWAWNRRLNAEPSASSKALSVNTA